MSKKLSREEFLKLLSQSELESAHLDELDKKALEGFKYLENDEMPTDVIHRLDERMEARFQVGKPKVSQQSRILSFDRYKRIAAVILLLLIPTYFLLKGPSTQRLFAENFEAPRSTYYQQSRGTSPEDNQALMSAFQKYELGSFSQAKEAIANLKSDHPDKPDLVFYEALAALGANDIDAAIQLFTDCREITFQDVMNRTPWFLALAHLKKGNRDQAVMWLETSLPVDEMHRQKAQELLKKLK